MAATSSPQNRPKRAETVKFDFAFDNPAFSDRILVLEKSPDRREASRDGCKRDAEEQDGSHRKRKRVDEASVPLSEPGFHCESKLRKQLHVSSAILAAKSPFFLKLFSNGMKESDQRKVEAVLHIKPDEEDIVQELLRFMYTGVASSLEQGHLLRLMLAADQYEVYTAIEYCSSTLQSLPMTVQNAVTYVTLPECLQEHEAVQSLVGTARAFLEDRYNDINTVWDNQEALDELMQLPASALEVVLGSDRVKVKSEISVFWTLAKWAKANKQLGSLMVAKLAEHIRFPWIPTRFMEDVMKSPVIERETCQRLLMEALFFRASPVYRQKELAAQAMHRRYIQRASRWLSVRSFEVDMPRKMVMIFLDLTRDDLNGLPMGNHRRTESVRIDGRKLYLLARHCQGDNDGTLGLSLGMRKDTDTDPTVRPVAEASGKVARVVAGSPLGEGPLLGEYAGATQAGAASILVPGAAVSMMEPVNVALEFYVRKKPNLKWEGLKNTVVQATSDVQQWGYNSILSTSWLAMMEQDSQFFEHGVMYLRVDVTFLGPVQAAGQF